MTQNHEPVIPHLGLVVLDVQAAFLKAIGNSDILVKRIQFCVETANLFHIPTIITEQRPKVLGATIDAIQSLNPEAPRVAKTGFSAFTETAFTDWVEDHSIHHILLTGIETPICVYQSALDAINQDLDVTILADAVGCRRNDDETSILAALRIHGGHILPSETIFYSILRDSKHAAFREFTQLVKKYSD